MIKIIIDQNSIELIGHAESDAYNHDLVCAGVSAITLGAASLWQTNPNIEVVQKENGYLKITFNNLSENDSSLQAQFQLLIHQLTTIAQNYRQNLMVQIK